MNYKIALTKLFLIFMSLIIGNATIITVASGSPQEMEVGVKVGDWATYGQIKATWISNDPEAEPDPSLILFNNTDWFKYMVAKLDGTVVWFQNITRMKDGAQTNNSLYIDVDQGYGNASTIFISADLSRGDSLYTDMVYPLYINETIFRTYLGVSRETNHLNLTFTDRTYTNPPQVMTYSFNFYWDRASGIITERQASSANRTENYLTTWSKSDIIVGTNLWSSDKTEPAALPLWVLGVVAVILLVVIVLYHQRKTRSKPRKRPKRRRTA